jgi:hypothetical protein
VTICRHQAARLDRRSNASKTKFNPNAGWGRFEGRCKTRASQLLAIKIELRRIMHDPIAKTGAWVKQMLKGHLNYFAVSGNHPRLW